MKRPLLALAAVFAIGISSYGILNTVSAFNDSQAPTAPDYSGINTAGLADTKPDGTFCNPYGCAACSGCVSLQYQENIEETSGYSLEIEP